MSSVTIIVSPPGPTGRSIKSLLRDLAALELLSEFLWVEGDLLRGSDASDVVAEHITRAHARRTRIGKYLANLDRPPSVLRVVALNFVGGQESLLGDDVLSRFLRDFHPFARKVDTAEEPSVVPLNCLVVRPGQGGWRPECAWIGWHNLVVAAQDASDPAAAPESLTTETDDAIFSAHAAAAVAGLAGMWSGLEASAFDGKTPDPLGERSSQVARAFYRRLDWIEAADAVLGHLAGSSDRLATPYLRSTALDRFDDPAAASAIIAGTVLENHRELFEAQILPSAPVKTQMGPIAALKLFGSFLWGALVTAPEVWARSVIRKGASLTAERVQHTVFGDDESESRFEIVVSGFNSKGEFVPAVRVAAEARELGSRLRPLLSMPEPRPDYLSGFWRDFVNGALTLADGGMGRGIEPRHAGTTPGYVARPAAIAPSPESVFVLPQGLAAHVGIRDVRAYDVRALTAIDRRLSALVESEESEAREADHCRTQLIEWLSAPRKAYVVNIGRRIVGELNKAQTELGTLTQRLTDLAGESDPAEFAKPVERSRKKLRRWALGLLVVLGALVALALTVLLSPVVAVGLAALAIVIFFVGSLRSFLKDQRKLFELLNRRSPEDERRLTTHLADATRRMDALTVMQAQYECWAPIVARFLEAPYERGARAHPSMPLITGPLPRALVIGRAVPSDDVVSSVAAQLEPSFQAGWLDPVWFDRLAASGEAWGIRGDERAIREAYYRDEARELDSPLRSMSMAAMAAGGHESDTALGAAIRTLTDSSHPELFEALTARIDSGRRRIDNAGFIADLTEPPARRDFRPDLFTSIARAAADRPQSVHDSVVIEGDTDYRSFVRSVLVVELSRPLSPDEIQLTDRHESVDPEHHERRPATRTGVSDATF